jgi:tetratricopeptide (TPR) repeat protein
MHDYIPLAHIMPHDMAWFLMWSDRGDEAYQYFEESRELNPGFQNGYMNLGLLYLMDGNFDLARENIRKALSTNHVYSDICLPFIDAMENPALRAKTVELVLAESKFENGVNGKARMLMFLGEPEPAMDHLEMAMEIGDPYAVHWNRVSVFDPLRDNPRFQALLKKMNILPE